MTALAKRLRIRAARHRDEGWELMREGDPSLLEQAARELDVLTGMVRCLLENDPNEDAADGGVTVLDVWRKDVCEHFGEWPIPSIPEDPFGLP